MQCNLAAISKNGKKILEPLIKKKDRIETNKRRQNSDWRYSRLWYQGITEIWIEARRSLESNLYCRLLEYSSIDLLDFISLAYAVQIITPNYTLFLSLAMRRGGFTLSSSFLPSHYSRFNSYLLFSGCFLQDRRRMATRVVSALNRPSLDSLCAPVRHFAMFSTVR